MKVRKPKYKIGDKVFVVVGNALRPGVQFYGISQTGIVPAEIIGVCVGKKVKKDSWGNSVRAENKWEVKYTLAFYPERTDNLKEITHFTAVPEERFNHHYDGSPVKRENYYILEVSKPVVITSRRQYLSIKKYFVKKRKRERMEAERAEYRQAKKIVREYEKKYGKVRN